MPVDEPATPLPATLVIDAAYSTALHRWYAEYLRTQQGMTYIMPPQAPLAAGDILFIDPMARQAPSVADNPPSAGTNPLPSAENSPEPLALWVHERSGRCAYCDIDETTRAYVKLDEEDQMSWKWCHPECQDVATQALINSR